MDISLKIDGMHCGGCVASVRRVLSAAEGVRSVDVDLDAGRAKVAAADGTDPAALVAAIEDAGYEASIAPAP
jgi:copper chaperone CopZ